jgi:hypothetical protein
VGVANAGDYEVAHDVFLQGLVNPSNAVWLQALDSRPV